MKHIKFSDLVGKTIIEIIPTGDRIEFRTQSGQVFVLMHDQDCCESVRIESVVGNWGDLIGSPILVAEEVSGDTPSDFKFEYEPESFTWTFYKLATIKGYVDIRWLGESNGYYSESVYLYGSEA
jgi:hypothetical protein